MEDAEQTPLLPHNRLHKTPAFGDAPGDSLGWESQGKAGLQAGH